MLRGIDVSNWKKDLNLASVACDFVIAKATGGTGFVDPSCDMFVQKAIELGKKWGIYHYYADGYSGDNAVAEADFFVDNCLGYIGKGMIILDWEKGGNPYWLSVGMAKTWLDRVYARTGVKPVIYISLNLAQTLDWSSVINAGYGLWVAAWPYNNDPIYNYTIDASLDPNPKWDGVVNDVLWQFTSTGRLDGYGGNLDCNLFFGDAAAWDAYAGVHPIETPPPAPTTTTTTTTAPVPEPTTTTTTTEAPLPIPTTTTTTTEAPSVPKNENIEAAKLLGRNGILAAVSALIAALADWILQALFTVKLPTDVLVASGSVVYALLLFVDKKIHDNASRLRGLVPF